MNMIVNQTVTKQRGLTLISWLVIIIFLLFQGVIAMKVIPVYMTDASVKSIMEKLPTDPTALETPTSELKNLIMKRLSMNNIYSIKPEDIKIKRKPVPLTVTLQF